MRQVFRYLEPYAFDLWEQDVERYIPAALAPASVEKRTWFGGLYQQLVITR